MKPWGMTAAFQIVRPTPTQDAIYAAVEAAIDAGMSVEDFRCEAQECWEICLDEKVKADRQAWERSNNGER